MTSTHAAARGVRVIDISVTLRKGLACWPGENFWKLEPVARMNDGDPCNVSKISMGAHMGTHVDAPWHFGSTDRTVDQIDLNRLVIGARVLDLTAVEKSVKRSDLEGRLGGVEAVIFKTKNSGKLESLDPFDTDFVHLAADGADYLVECGIRTLGVDYLSIDGFYVNGAPSHHAVLATEMYIVEGLDLMGVEPGDYLFIALPLKIAGADGAPARAILIDAGAQEPKQS